MRLETEMSDRKIMVRTFKLGTHDERARKIGEEALEVYAAFAQYDEKVKKGNTVGAAQKAIDLMTEIGDVITAAVNFAEALGINAQVAVEFAEQKNRKRGRYYE